MWSETSVHDRSALLHRVADLLVANKAEVARAESLDTGKRLVETEYDVDDIVGVFRYYANTAAEDAGRVVDTGQAGVRSRIVHEPVGVCALITPWNYPLLQTSWKVAPCLAAGNTLRAQAQRADAVDRDPADALPDRGRVCRPASATSCSAPGPTRAPRSRPTPTSTWSRSPVACRPAGS